MEVKKVSTEDLKKQFEKLQKAIQGVKEDKIRTESELKTLQADYDSQLKELLELTGASSIEEAVQVYQSRSKSLEEEKAKLESELEKYLATYEASSVEI